MFSAEYIVTRGYRYTLLADIAAAAKHQPTIHEYPHRRHPDTTTSSTNSHRQNGQYVKLPIADCKLVLNFCAQNQRTRLSTTSRRRPTGTGEPSPVDSPALRGGHSIDSGINSIKKPKTHRYPSLNGTDPKFRRNHRHALHGTMKALVRSSHPSLPIWRLAFDNANKLHRRRSRTASGTLLKCTFEQQTASELVLAFADMKDNECHFTRLSTRR